MTILKTVIFHNNADANFNCLSYLLVYHTGQNISLTNVSTSTDDKPVIEFANAEAAKRWRYSYLKNSILLKND